MSLRESETSRPRRAARAHAKQQALDALAPLIDRALAEKLKSTTAIAPLLPDKPQLQRKPKPKKQQARKKKVRGRSVGIGHNGGPPLLESLGPLLDDRCLTFAEWCALNGIGLRNGRRILQSGTGPAVVQLSARRIGITVRANREWQERRARVR
jgi:hypothetical protein